MTHHHDVEVLPATRENSASSHRREEAGQDAIHKPPLIGRRCARSTLAAELRPPSGTLGRYHGELGDIIDDLSIEPAR